MEDRCIICNEIIPEGRMICPLCERVQIKVGTILQSFDATKEEVKATYNVMEENNDD